MDGRHSKESQGCTHEILMVAFVAMVMAAFRAVVGALKCTTAAEESAPGLLMTTDGSAESVTVTARPKKAIINKTWSTLLYVGSKTCFRWDRRHQRCWGHHTSGIQMLHHFYL